MKLAIATHGPPRPRRQLSHFTATSALRRLLRQTKRCNRQFWEYSELISAIIPEISLTINMA